MNIECSAVGCVCHINVRHVLSLCIVAVLVVDNVDTETHASDGLMHVGDRNCGYGRNTCGTSRKPNRVQSPGYANMPPATANKSNQVVCVLSGLA